MVYPLKFKTPIIHLIGVFFMIELFEQVFSYSDLKL